MKDTSAGYKGAAGWPHGMSKTILGPRAVSKARR